MKETKLYSPEVGDIIMVTKSSEILWRDSYNSCTEDFNGEQFYVRGVGSYNKVLIEVRGRSGSVMPNGYVILSDKGIIKVKQEPCFMNWPNGVK